MMSEEDAAKWLAGGHGEPPKALAKRVQELLLKGYKAGYWTEDDMMDGTNMPSSAAKDLWVGIAKDSATAEKTTFGHADSVRLQIWVDAHYEGADETDSWDGYVPSEAEQKDLDAQQMTSGKHLRRLELALYLFRASTDAGIADGVYRGIPNVMKDAKLAIKQQHQTFDIVLKECLKTGALARMERSMMELVDDLAKSEDSMDQKQSAKVSRWWSEAKRNMADKPRALLLYIDEYRSHYRGRGLPVDYDPTLGQRAWHQAEGSITWKMDPGASRSTTESVVSGYSSLGSSASMAQSSASDEQLKEVMAAMKGLTSTVQSLASQVGVLKDSVADDSRDSKMRCSKCGELGHRAKNCPLKKKLSKPPKEEATEEEE